MSKMSNEEKTLRMMLAKPLISVKILPKLLDDLKEIADKVKLDFPEFMIVFAMEILRTTLLVGKEVGLSVDIDGLAEALKTEMARKEEEE